VTATKDEDSYGTEDEFQDDTVREWVVRAIVAVLAVAAIVGGVIATRDDAAPPRPLDCSGPAASQPFGCYR
jgi:hypothetical protein